LSWHRNFGWITLAIVMLALGIAPDIVTFPAPEAAVVLDRATYIPAGADTASEVRLPHAIFAQTSQTDLVVRYVIHFDLPREADKGYFVLISSTNRRVSLSLNNENFFGFDSSALWTGPLLSTPVMARLPRSALVAGRNQLTIAVEKGEFALPSYLSQIYVGTEAGLAMSYKLRTFFDNQFKTMALAAHVLMGIGLIFAYFFRPKDPLFGWLAVFNVVSLVVAIGLFIGWQPAFHRMLPYIVILTPASGLLFFGVALALVHVPPPRALRYVIVFVSLALLPLAIVDTPTAKTIAAAIGAVIVMIVSTCATALIAWGAFRQRNIDARLMLGPYFLLAWFAVRDAYVTATLPEHGFNLLFPYQRPVFLALLTVVLMRRMGVSLDQLDSANETLNIKLAEREAELALLHRQERAKTVSSVRDHERQRLTHDLHDGLSGHLVSIIALSERAGDKPTEQAAREALNDLRLVIYSLDLGDRELPLALANFRERLIPHLHRLGVELDWSIAGLPEVSGVTPGNALAVLRVLQEAITNALKHGPARKISIRGAPAAGNKVAITIENDGRPFVETNRGYGLANMRRRAQQLHGSLVLEALESGMRVVLLLPATLPDFEPDVVE
jgi:two-component system sensor histidine kinase UhpB